MNPPKSDWHKVYGGYVFWPYLTVFRYIILKLSKLSRIWCEIAYKFDARINAKINRPLTKLQYSERKDFCYKVSLRSQIEGYTRLSIFRKFFILPAVILAYPFIDIQEIFSLFVFSTTQINFFPSSPLLLEPTRLLNLDKNSSLPFYQSLPLY